ncbi:MAG: hypothetical protein IGS48_11530 [Oscillatoriales cyanobacterium C42_A2020_001]|nr:hypothetical protein [Leptolyngbyaceae cyanobacterium C42_A2020_001]
MPLNWKATNQKWRVPCILPNWHCWWRVWVAVAPNGAGLLWNDVLERYLGRYLK